MIIFEATSIVAIWAYINFFIDTEFYTDMVVDSDTYVTWTVCEVEAFRYFHMLHCCMYVAERRMPDLTCAGTSGWN